MKNNHFQGVKEENRNCTWYSFGFTCDGGRVRLHMIMHEVHTENKIPLKVFSGIKQDLAAWRLVGVRENLLRNNKNNNTTTCTVNMFFKGSYAYLKTEARTH